MEFSHSLDQAEEFARDALSLMRQREIVPHPNNYTVWYSYASHEYPDLNQALEIVLDSKNRFSEAEVRSVFRGFCASPFDAIPVHLIADKMEAELSTVLAAVDTAAHATATYGASLEEASDVMEAMRCSKDLRLLILAILRKTRVVARQSRDIEQQLRQSLTEIGHLRQELEGARLEAMTDALTGLANRKMFDFALREVALEAMESDTPLSLIMLDIDHFKSFNDTYGHAIGDQVLKLLAVTLKECVKGQDTAARYGGEEFAVILPRTVMKDAAALAEGIRTRVANKSVVHRRTGDQLGRVSVSIGVAQFTFGEPLRKFVERADQALYFAKRGGRNRVACEVDMPPKGQARSA
jgi:diguanylate cyclase (GGDEF) domain